MTRLRLLVQKWWRVAPGGAAHRLHESFARPSQRWVWSWRLFLATRPYTVVCQRCGTAFQSAIGIGNGTQANKCGSSCVDGRVFCHCGSHLDGHVYMNDPKVLPAWDPVCDACIHALVLQGALRHVGDYFGLGPNERDWADGST